jgi:Na+-transporting NADH:ubiquinone oxidoreductase subunit A
MTGAGHACRSGRRREDGHCGIGPRVGRIHPSRPPGRGPAHGVARRESCYPSNAVNAPPASSHAGSRPPSRFRLRRGLDLRLDGAPEAGRIGSGPPVASVALLGDDAPGVRPELRVAAGDRVRLGQTLWVDRRRPAVRFTAPGAGRVTGIERGPRRRLDAVVIALEGDDEERFDPVAPGGLASLPRERLEALLLDSGLWTTLRTRPFSRIPDPGSAPRSLFVTAMESEPLAPPAERVIADHTETFAHGVAALARLVDGPVHVCARPDAGLPLPDVEGVALAEFEGPHPVGLPGTHIHFLDPVGPDRSVWHVGWADVIAIGSLLATGRVPTERVVALTGPSVVRPRLVRTRAGASTEDLVRGELREGPCRVLSGSVLAGRWATGWAAFLGRRHTQVCALPEGAGPAPGWLAPGRRGTARRVLALGVHRGWTTSLGGRRGAFFPLERVERVVPLELMTLPLLRALVVGDVDAALELGALELAEEDLALATLLCPGKLEYGLLLRNVLDELERQAS